ncbi:hypothetical protein MOF23_07375 [Bacillus inaquosorum]|uniref:hypothetical protein n=1 Tax=Bacillus inaquosorum TaxID=483913 RepID=UPI00227E964F|nr:hypothetical protein [Bacillus inaquosorum]MCY9308798.1 hypothetical protein [Bacillus inaquosorum]
MDLKNETLKDIHLYKKERQIMNVTQFDMLLKRVNIEENTEIKTQMLSVIEKYIGTISSSEVVIAEAQTPQDHVEDIEEAEIENVQQEAAATPVIEAGLHVPKEEVVEALAESVEALDQNNRDSAEEKSDPTEEKKEAASIQEDPIIPSADEVSKEPTPNYPKSEEVTHQADKTEYVETFGLIAPTKDEHLKQIIERGGVIFREKRSFMLMLCLDDELIAIAKTAKLEQFPDHIQKHLKDGGYVSVEIVSFSEITKKSRARYTDVTYTNLQLLDQDHWIVENMTKLLEKGVAPDHSKAKNTKTQDKTEVNEAPKKTDVNSQEESEPYLISSFLIHPSFAQTFKEQKDQVKQQLFNISCSDGQAQLIATNSNGQVVIGMNDKSPLKDNQYSVKIADYTIKEQDNSTFIQFKFTINEEKESVQPAPGSQVESDSPNLGVNEEEENKPLVEVKAISEVPEDFPLANTLTLQLHSKAEAMFKEEQAKAMIGQPVNLGMTNREGEQGGRISLVYDVFEMATTNNVLTNKAMPNSKWVARLTNIDVLANEQTQTKTLKIEFDHLVEVEAFTAEDTRNIMDFVPITEESFAERQKEIAEKQAAVKQPEKTAQTAEQLLNKEVDPKDAQQLVDPHASANYQAGYQELVSSQSKDMGGSVQEIRNQTAMTGESRQEVTEQASNVISGVISKTLNETGIHTQTQEKPKQSTEIMGNLQDGAGNLTQTETVINFATGYSPQSWAQSVGKQVNLNSAIQFGGPVTTKTVQMVGSNGTIVAQGQVAMNEALLVDGNQHSATLLGIENAVQEQQGGYTISLRLGNFKKVA